MANATPKPTVVSDVTFDAPKSRTNGPKLSKAERSKIAKAAGKKAAASRKAQTYTVKVRDASGKITTRTVNGSQLAGMRAAVARRAAKQSKSA